MNKSLCVLAALAASAVAAPAMAQTYYAYTTLDYAQPVTITFVDGATYGGDLTYQISQNGSLRISKPGPVTIRVRFADGTSYTTSGALNPQAAVRSQIDPSARYWCLFVGKTNIGLSVEPLCARYAEGDRTVTRNQLNQ
jgi:hypothetical protein